MKTRRYLCLTACLRVLAFCLMLCLLPAAWGAVPDSPVPSPRNPTMTLAVDASEAPRGLLHMQIVLPVSRSGPLTLVYPKWLPGYHAPDGPIADLASVVFTAQGRVLPWQRDLVDMFAFHLVVPPRTTQLQIQFDLLCSSDPDAAIASANLLNLVWTSVILYPQRRTADGINVRASLRLPSGWNYATALPVEHQSADTVYFLTAPLVTLLDSPVSAGVHTKVIPLTPPGVFPPAEIDLTGDTPETIALPDTQIQAYKNLVREASALFGATHYRSYHFLYTLSDFVHGEGLEHHESSEDTAPADTFRDSPNSGTADLLPHEYTHSWNGKYRRPDDLYTPDYQQPMRDDLLWVYEGMTEYWGKVLTARCGLWTADEYRESLAETAARLDHEPGRAWRPLVDTAVSSQNLYGPGNGGWRALRRGVDYYDEMVLIWLEADTIMRRQTGGRKSLDDFCRLFHGPPSTPPECRTYTLKDVVKTLNTVAPYDWQGFLMSRVYAIQPQAPLGGILGSGWHLVYNDTPNTDIETFEKRRHAVNLIYSLGLTVSSKEGTLREVIPGMPGALAGLAPGMKLVAVNGRAYDGDLLKSVVKDSKTVPGPISLLIESSDMFKTYFLDYHGGAQYPHLERDTAKTDLLTAILTSLRPVKSEAIK